MNNIVFKTLIEKYGKLTLSRAELSKELSMSISMLDKLLAADQLPIRYHRLGNSQKAKYAFALQDVADYLSFVDKAAA